MKSKFAAFGHWFWNENFWLPPNVTWSDIGAQESVTYASFSDLGYPLVYACVLIAIRSFVENKVFRPLGRRLGIKERRRRRPATNDVLENAFALLEASATNTFNHEEIIRLSKQLHMTERRIERWLRQRALIGKPSKLDKFSETGWRWLYYTSIFTWGLAALWPKTWLWNITDCWYNYPHHNVDTDVWWYYMAELAFYWGLLGTQFVDVKRKDFWVMFIHHAATIMLLSFSWTCNFFKVGTLVLLIHDIADIFLESAKLFKYSGAQRISELLFGSFAVTWIVTRLGIFPTWIIYSVTVEAPQLVQYFPAYFIFNGLLSLLLLLNILWAYYILKVAYTALFGTTGTIAKDIRSETSSDNDEEDEEDSKKDQ